MLSLYSYVVILTDASIAIIDIATMASYECLTLYCNGYIQEMGYWNLCTLADLDVLEFTESQRKHECFTR